MLVIIGDTHAKDKEPFFIAFKKLLGWLNDTFPTDDLFFAGDCFDSSSPHWRVFSVFSSFLENRKGKIFILEGNHDYSRIKGSVLDGLKHIKTVNIIRDVTEMVYEKSRILCLPFKYGKMKEEYEALTGEYDYIITHTTPYFEAFGDEGINYKLKGTFIHGHTHIVKNKFHNDGKNSHIFVEVPYPTRFGEHLIGKNSVITLKHDSEKNNNILDYVEIPFFFTYETVKFGEKPKNKNNILNIVDAPDANSVYEEYKDYYIRDEGLELKRSGIESEEGALVFDDITIKKEYKTFCIENGISSEIINCGLKYLEGI